MQGTATAIGKYPLLNPDFEDSNPLLYSAPAVAIRKLVWLYFILLLVEGALRKWILPSQSDKLLLVRDPVALLIYYHAFGSGIFQLNQRLKLLLILCVVSIPLAVIGGGFKLLPIMYGVRIHFLHFPLIFIMPLVCTYRDVIKMGRMFLMVSPLMTLVIINQFESGVDDQINAVAGGGVGALETSGGKVRASGTFSFVSGVVYYYAFLLCFTIIGFLRKGTYSNLLLWVSVAFTILAIVTSGSRSVVAGVIHVLACFAFLAYYRPQSFGSAFSLIFTLTIAVLLLSRTEIYNSGVQFLKMRFDEASNVEGDAVTAYFERNKKIVFSPVQHSFGPFVDFWGRGLGSGTQGCVRLGAPKAFFGENEWERHIVETGPIIGNFFILWRVSLAWFLLLQCIQAIKRDNYLPIFIWGASSHIILWGPIGQPTTLGFFALGAGLCLASIRYRTASSVAGFPTYNRG